MADEAIEKELLEALEDAAMGLDSIVRNMEPLTRALDRPRVSEFVAVRDQHEGEESACGDRHSGEAHHHRRSLTC